jgi:hypothetical protein
MLLNNGKFISAVFVNSRKKDILAVWQDDATLTTSDVVVEVNLEDMSYRLLVETFTIDEITQMTTEKHNRESLVFAAFVKKMALDTGLVYDPAAANKQGQLDLTNIFDLPGGDVGIDLLFNIKLKIFDLQQVTDSSNTALKKQLREAKTPLEAFYICGKFLFE